FFFSSRRRHTRCYRDWSSDVCSSDLFLLSTRRGKQFNSMVHGDIDYLLGARRSDVLMSAEDAKALGVAEREDVLISNDVGSYREIGRASCREREERRGGSVSV